jgi:oxygen-dependent protoporphyrinogen oxidase
MTANLPEKALHLNSRVKIERGDSGKWILSDEDGRSQSFDAICLSVSAGQAAALIRSIYPVFASKLECLYFESVATLNLAYKREQISHALNSFGFVVPAIEKKSLMACTFASHKYSNRSPEGYVLLRAFVGGAFGKEFFEMNDKDLKKAVTNDLDKLLGIVGEPCFYSIARHPKALPQYAVNHKQWVSEIEESAKNHPGLFLTGASYRGTGITNCVKDAELEADKIYERLYSVIPVTDVLS